MANVHYLDHQFLAMGGPCRLRLECEDESLGQRAIRTAEQEVQRLEEKYSRYLPESLTSQVNRLAGSGKSMPIDPETAGMLRYADTLWRESDGMFDLTSGILRRAWNFKSGGLPQESELTALLPLIGWNRVEWDEEQLRLPDTAMELDFGGCVKEYACDSVAGKLSGMGIKHALVDLAGDMTATGPRADNSAWTIGIRNPGEKTRAIAHTALRSGGLASSGSYERCLIIDGKRYGHILSPTTGWPIDGLLAVSVKAPQCLVAGSTATLAMLKPAAVALDWLAQMGLPWLAIDQKLQCHGAFSHQTVD